MIYENLSSIKKKKDNTPKSTKQSTQVIKNSITCFNIRDNHTIPSALYLSTYIFSPLFMYLTAIQIMKKLHLLLAAFLLLAFSCQMQNEPEAVITTPVSTSHDKLSNEKDIVLVHGAWHPEEVWESTKSTLKAKGYRPVSVQLPGLGYDMTPAAEVTFADHVETVKAAINSLPGKVTLVGHSYGGMVIAQAAEDMPNKVRAAVFVSAFLPINGESVLDLGPLDTASVAGQNLQVDPQAMTISVPSEVHVEAFYTSLLSKNQNNQAVSDQVDQILPLIRPQPLATFTTPVQLGENFEQLPKYYISSLNDQAITPGLQQYMIQRYANSITVFTLEDSDHTPFITEPNLLEELFSVL